MKIKLYDNIYWDLEKETQNENTLTWIHQNILTNMSLDNSEKDKYGRPIRWEFKMDGYTVEVIREYIFPNSGKWSKKCDKINVYD